jgi:nascent polypeptide-associated complex subunit beta
LFYRIKAVVAIPEPDVEQVNACRACCYFYDCALLTKSAHIIVLNFSSILAVTTYNFTTSMSEADNIAAARARMIAKRFGGASTTSTGGKGSVRRKKKPTTRQGTAQSDAKLTSTLKKLGATNIAGIEEVNFFRDDGKVIHFKNPKLQAAVSANTYVVSGANETKTLQELLPGIASQLGVNDLSALQNMAGGAGGMSGQSIPEGDEDDDDDVPDLVEGNFEEAAEK